MTTSWRETQQIEAHLLGAADTPTALVFEARLLLDDELAQKTLWQSHTYKLVRQYGREQLRKEMEDVHDELFSLPQHKEFARRIRSLFNKK